MTAEKEGIWNPERTQLNKKKENESMDSGVLEEKCPVLPDQVRRGKVAEGAKYGDC